MSSFFLTQGLQLNTQEFIEYTDADPQLDASNAHFIPDNLFPSEWEEEDEKYLVDEQYYMQHMNHQFPAQPQQYNLWCNTNSYYDHDDVSKSAHLSFGTSERSNVDSLDEKQISVDFAAHDEEIDFRPKTLDDVRRHDLITTWALKRHTSMKLQEFLTTATDEAKRLAWNQIANKALDLSQNQYGNMFMQEFLVHASPNLRMEMAYHLTSHVKEMSHDAFGCWVIQKAIEIVPNIGDVWIGQQNGSSLTDEDLGELIVCKHGHYVIQKLLEKNISPSALERIERVLYGKIRELCVDSSGYHVVLDILEYATPQFNEHLLNEVSKHCLILSKDQYGNYVVKRVIEMNDNISDTIGVVVLRNLEALSLNKFATHVVEAYLEKCSTAELNTFITKLLSRSDNKLVRFLKHQTGNYVAQRLIRSAARKDVKKIRQRLDRRGLKKSVQNSHGCHVIEVLEKKLKSGK